MSHPFNSVQAYLTSSANAPIEMPLELILSVIEAACVGSSEKERLRILRSCSLVCRLWSNVSQQLLFSRAVLGSRRAFDAFAAALDNSTIHGQFLRHSVTSIRVVFNSGQQSCLGREAFQQILDSCPNVRELWVSLFGPSRKATPPCHSLQCAGSLKSTIATSLQSRPMLTSLHINDWQDEDESYLLHLLSLSPRLGTLSLGGRYPPFPISPTPKLRFALSDLRLNYQTSPSVSFIKWLLSNSTETLRAVTFDRDPFPDVLEYLATYHGHTLEALSLRSSIYISVLSRCSKMKKFRVSSPIASSCSSLFKQLPPTLRKLSMVIERDTPLSLLIEYVKCNDHLEELVIQLWDDGSRNILLSPLRIACALQGVTLHIPSHPRGMLHARVRSLFFKVLLIDSLQSARS